MGDYRVYTLNKAGKTTGLPYIVRCEDVDAALILALLPADDQVREIWEGAWRVATISAAKGAPTKVHGQATSRESN